MRLLFDTTSSSEYKDERCDDRVVKGQVSWISEKQRLPVKTSGKACFYGEQLHCGRFYDRRECVARPSIVRKEIGGALAWSRGHLPFKTMGLWSEDQFLPRSLRLCHWVLKTHYLNCFSLPRWGQQCAGLWQHLVCEAPGGHVVMGTQASVCLVWLHGSVHTWMLVWQVTNDKGNNLYNPFKCTQL